VRKNTGAARIARIGIRLSREDRDRVEQGVKSRGYRSPSAFIRAAIQNELDGRPELTETEDRIAGGFDRVFGEVTRVKRGQQALFALFDSFVRTILTCLPEPSNDLRPQAIARAKERYHQLIKAAGQTMTGDAFSAIQDLIGHGKN
jgi:Arc/MetJ-type ribon-helix-helix transcriptional regulator